MSGFHPHLSKPVPEKKVPVSVNERRRTLRIKRSGLLDSELQDMDRPAIKFAETREELVQSFSLVYQVYLQKKFITEPKSHRMLYSIYSLLPETVHIVAKSYLTVISNLTVIFDTPEFGLPMDVIYRPEVDELRSQGKNVVELSSLATPREHCWKNMFHYLVQVMYWYTVYKDIDFVCIAVNPRHVRYYKNLFPFEYMGPTRHYPRVEAPAVALKARVKESMSLMMEICRKLEFDTPFYSYFYRMTGQAPRASVPFLEPSVLEAVSSPMSIDVKDIKYFIQTDPAVLEDLSLEQLQALNAWYAGLGV